MEESRPLIMVFAPNPLARVGLMSLLDGLSAYRFILHNGDPQTGVAQHHPTALLWDMSWDTGSALVLLTMWPEPPPILALLPEGADAGALLRAGVLGCLVADSATEALGAALHAILSGLMVLDPAYYQAPPAPPESPPTELTPREREVLGLIALGLPNKTIARQLGVSDHTVKFHLNAIFAKLGAQSRTEAVVRAAKLGWLTL